jgi:hypothetical protein
MRSPAFWLPRVRDSCKQLCLVMQPASSSCRYALTLSLSTSSSHMTHSPACRWPLSVPAGCPLSPAGPAHGCLKWECRVLAHNFRPAPLPAVEAWWLPHVDGVCYIRGFVGGLVTSQLKTTCAQGAGMELGQAQRYSVSCVEWS